MILSRLRFSETVCELRLFGSSRQLSLFSTVMDIAGIVLALGIVVGLFVVGSLVHVHPWLCQIFKTASPAPTPPPTVVLVGKKSVGKTLLHGLLAAGPLRVQLVDTPGEGSSLGALVRADAVAFVLDSSLDDLEETARYLHDVLQLVGRAIPVLILCNKRDKASSHNGHYVRRWLELHFDQCLGDLSTAKDYRERFSYAESKATLGCVREVEQLIEKVLGV